MAIVHTPGGERSVSLFERTKAPRNRDQAAALNQMADALCFSEPGDTTAACLEDGRLLGAVCWRPRHFGATLVCNLGSARQGLGTLLLAQAAADAAGRGEGLTLEAVPSAVGFYERLGFTNP